MSEIDLSGVAPLRRAETRRRIGVIRDYLRLKRPDATARKAAAQSLGIGTQQFMNLVRAWRLSASATAIAKAGANGGEPRQPRKRGLPTSTREAAEDALRGLPASASHKDAIAAVRTMCEQRSTRPPSDSMVSYLRMAVRRSGTAADGEPGVVIGRAIAGLPMLASGGMVLPEIVLAVSSTDGGIICAALVRPGDPAPTEIATVARTLVRPGPGHVTIGADDEALAAPFFGAKIVSRFVAGRLLAKTLGRGVGDVRLSYGPLASTDPNRLLRADADEALEWWDALAALTASLSAHNTARGAPAPCVINTDPES